MSTPLKCRMYPYFTEAFESSAGKDVGSMAWNTDTLWTLPESQQ